MSRVPSCHLADERDQATWKNGQTVPDEKVEWPEGCRLLVEPIPAGQAFGLREEDWPDTPEAVADWLRWYDSLEPLEFTPEEAADLAAWRQQVKEYTIANMDRDVQGWFP